VLDLVGNAAVGALLERAESCGTGLLTEYYFGRLRQSGGQS
jgi:hypothetical protein